MANEDLNAQLQVLRDEYTQRQKAASGATAALKGKSSLLAKLQKALDAYNIWDASPTLDTVNQAAGTLREASAPLTDQAGKADKQFGAIAGILKEVSGALSTTPIDVVRLNTVLEKLRKLNVPDERITGGCFRRSTRH